MVGRKSVQEDGAYVPEYWFSTKGDSIPGDTGDILGCHSQGPGGVAWPLVGRGQGQCSASYNAQASPQSKYPTPNVTTAKLRNSVPNEENSFTQREQSRKLQVTERKVRAWVY